MSNSRSPFTVIGENVHTSRVVLKKGKRFVIEDGREGVPFTSVTGEQCFLPVSETIRASQDYAEGRIKHVKLAVQTAMGGGASAGDGVRYVHRMVANQEEAGAHFVDINVDEISTKLDEQRAAMVWLVDLAQSMTHLPISVDSSDLTIIEAGLQAVDGRRGRPLLNSASLERPDALDLAVERGARVIVTAAGDSGMPNGSDERVQNASKMIDLALAKGIPADDIYVDPLVFPIAVDSTFGHHSLDAIRAIRKRYGPEIHITGGMSNVSFGIPARNVMNAVFINLAVEAGADSGIIDPVMNRLDTVFAADRRSSSYRLAEDALLGRDENCLTYIKAWRAGDLPPFKPPDGS
jgi:5-methyltetrahydrofolate--homocysteine methyltransferase